MALLLSHSAIPPMTVSGPAFSNEILLRILQHLPPLMDRAGLQQLSMSCTIFQCGLQPFLFRHVNLRDFEEAFTFFDIMGRPRAFNLASGIHTLQISLNLQPDDEDEDEDEDDNEDSDEDEEEDTDSVNESPHMLFFQQWHLLQPRLPNLHTLVVCFSHGEGGFAEHFVGDYRPQLLPRLKKLHLSPIPEEAWFGAEEDENNEPDNGPWDDVQAWAALLCNHHLWRIEYLIVSTPGHPFWPPTNSQARIMHRSWFDDLPHTSKLHTFVLHCGYGAECARLERYRDEDPDDVPHGLVEGERSSMYGEGDDMQDGRIPTILWTKELDREGRTYWDENGHGVYCGFGEHLFFDEFRHLYEKVDVCLFGHEEDLFESKKFRERPQVWGSRRFRQVSFFSFFHGCDSLEGKRICVALNR
ncbi:hypothetical protein B0H19DRAFT_1177227 [Mycena capillaripes]|nr:hypothetical protein B0H19DRAFT_1177227 [Mycena capillaripes]